MNTVLHYEPDKGKTTCVLRCVFNIISAKHFNYSRATERLTFIILFVFAVPNNNNNNNINNNNNNAIV